MAKLYVAEIGRVEVAMTKYGCATDQLVQTSANFSVRCAIGAILDREVYSTFHESPLGDVDEQASYSHILNFTSNPT